MSLVKFDGVRLSNAGLIAGFFKEALFFSRSVQLVTDNGLRALMIESIEETSRSASTQPKISLSSTNPFFVKPGSLFEFHCIFPHLTATWKGELTQTGPTHFTTRAPKHLFVSNLRNSLRLEPLTDRSIESSVLVNSADLHCEGRLAVEQISVQGVGGILRVPAGMTIGVDTTLVGRVELEFGSLAVSAQVIHARLIESGESEHTFQVGLIQNRAKLDRPQGKERRGSYRLATALKLIARSPLHPTRQFELDVVNASVTGFATQLPDASTRPFLPLGVGLSINNSTLVAEVIEVAADQIRYQFVAGTAADRLVWIKRLSAFLETPAETRTGVGFDLVSLFCQSGALAAQHIKNQKNKLNAAGRALAFESGNEGWMHRWIERGRDGDVRGHVCAILMGDNLWHLGEIAGSPLKETRISPTFLPRFFKYMRDYAISCAPCPKFVIAWNRGHKFWRGFESYLDSDGACLVRGRFSVTYVRSNPHKVAQRPKEKIAAVSQIKASDFDMIEKMLAEFRGASWLELVTALGFSVDNFGSPRIERMSFERERQFKRFYAVVNDENSRALAILSEFPPSSSLNRTFDVAWLFPITGDGRQLAANSGLLDAVRSFAASLGLSTPGFLIPIPDADDTNGTKTMRWTICHPDALLWFEEAKR